MRTLCRMSCYVGLIACALLPGYLFTLAPLGEMSPQGSPLSMSVGMLLILLAVIALLGMCWWQLLTTQVFGVSAFMTTIYMLAPIQRCPSESCGGIRVADVEAHPADEAVLAEVTPLVIIDLCAALIAPRMHLQAALKVLNQQGIEVAVYSALDAWHTRAALRNAGMMEWFDYVWHMDAMSAMEPFDYALLQAHGVINTPEELKLKPLMTRAKVPPSKVPAWMRWLA